MNAEAERLMEARKEEIERLGGLGAYRLRALQNLKLKTVVKESHASAVHTLVVNHTSPSLGNLFATVGHDQATVYDDEHMGDHVALVCHFTNAPSEHASGGQLSAAAWLSSEGWSEQPAGDACLAVAGADPNISVISVAEARVTHLLRGHGRDVVELAAAGPGAPRLLASLSREGNLRLWNVPSEACLSSLQHPDASCIAMAPDGTSLLVGGIRGRLQQYAITGSLPTGAAAGAAAAAAAAPAAAVAPASADLQRQQQQQQQDCQQNTVAGPRIDEASRRDVQCQGSCHSDTIDCMRFLPNNRLATKSTDGRMFVWRVIGSSGSSGGSGGSGGGSSMQLEPVATWKVPNCSGGSGWSSRCQFGATRDGRYIAVGNSKGDCFVFDAESGERVGHLPAVRVSAPVRACGLSEDCRHLLAVLGKGFVFRYEYHGLLPANQEGSEGGSGGGGSGQQDGKENTNAGQQSAE